MKKLIITIFIGLALQSCKRDFIILTPEDSYTANNFYKTEAHFRSALVAAYAPLRDVLINDYFTSEMHSDNSVYQALPSNRGTAIIERENISDFQNTSVNAYVAATWQHSYTGISRCNIIIDRLAQSSVSTDAKLNIDGQAKFLRALNYFKLVRLFGGVPLFLNEVNSAAGAFKSRATVEEVYNQIISDANDAFKQLGAPAKFPQTGEATKGAAATLLAEVYMIQKKWSAAEELLQSVTKMRYDLLPKYADVFLPANKNSKESIFEIQFLGGTATGATPNPLSYHFIPRSTDTKILTGVTINNTATGGWNTPSSDLIAAYEPNDKRLDASIGIAEGAYNGSYYFVYSAAKSIINYKPSTGKIGVPYVKKYLTMPVEAASGSSNNFPLYRFADVLLLLAEAMNEQGKTNDALDQLNKVRTRAGLDDVTTTDQDVARAFILKERRVELAFENHRWTDLLRSGNALNIMNTFGVAVKKELTYLASDAYVLDKRHLLFPIPQGEIELNPELKQNHGY